MFSLGVALAKHCGLARAAAVVPGVAVVPSITRRFERLLANPRLDVRVARDAVVAEVLGAARGQTLWLGLDAASRRVDGTSPGLKILSAVHIPDDGRLSCIVTAAGREDVLRLFEIALLPSARVLEVVDV